MRKLIAALLTAASLATPALAQDRDPGGGGVQAAPERDWHREGGDEHRRDQARPAPAQPQGQAPQAAQQRPDWQGRRGGWNGGQRGQVAPGTPAQQGFQGPAYDQRRRQLDAMRAQAQAQQQQQQQQQQQRGWQDHRDVRDDRRDPRQDRRDFREDRRDGQQDRHDWQRDRQGWRGDDRGRWNQGWRNDQRYDWQRYRYQNRSAFHLPRYYAPRGWNYGYRRFSLGVYLNAPLFAQSYWIDEPVYYHLPPAYGPYRWVRYYNDVMLVDVRTGYVVDAIYDFFW